MGWWQAVAAGMRLSRARRGQVGGGLLALAGAATFRWLAGRRPAVPPVRATGVAPNSVYPFSQPPRDRGPGAP